LRKARKRLRHIGRMKFKTVLEVNQTYSGHGNLKDDFAIVGRADFSFSYKDDGEYLSKDGFITKIELLGKLSMPSSVLEGTFDGLDGKRFRLELTTSLDQMDVFELARGHIDRLPFAVRSVSTI